MFLLLASSIAELRYALHISLAAQCSGDFYVERRNQVTGWGWPTEQCDQAHQLSTMFVVVEIHYKKYVVFNVILLRLYAAEISDNSYHVTTFV